MNNKHEFEDEHCCGGTTSRKIFWLLRWCLTILTMAYNLFLCIIRKKDSIGIYDHCGKILLFYLGGWNAYPKNWLSRESMNVWGPFLGANSIFEGRDWKKSDCSEKNVESRPWFSDFSIDQLWQLWCLVMFNQSQPQPAASAVMVRGREAHRFWWESAREVSLGAAQRAEKGMWKEVREVSKDPKMWYETFQACRYLQISQVYMVSCVVLRPMVLSTQKLPGNCLRWWSREIVPDQVTRGKFFSSQRAGGSSLPRNIIEIPWKSLRNPTEIL